MRCFESKSALDGFNGVAVGCKTAKGVAVSRNKEAKGEKQNKKGG